MSCKIVISLTEKSSWIKIIISFSRPLLHVVGYHHTRSVPILVLTGHSYLSSTLQCITHSGCNLFSASQVIASRVCSNCSSGLAPMYCYYFCPGKTKSRISSVPRSSLGLELELPDRESDLVTITHYRDAYFKWFRSQTPR